MSKYLNKKVQEDAGNALAISALGLTNKRLKQRGQNMGQAITQAQNYAKGKIPWNQKRVDLLNKQLYTRIPQPMSVYKKNTAMKRALLNKAKKIKRIKR